MWSSSHNPIALLVSGLIALSLPECHGDDDAAFFEARIRPLLIRHCIQCHGPKKQEGGLRLDTRPGWLSGGDRGAAMRSRALQYYAPMCAQENYTKRISQ